MQSKATTIADYLKELPEDRKKIISDMHKVITKNLPKGFEVRMSYGMIGYVVPHSLYSDGYHCTPELPLPFMNVASQKNFIALYHMGLYANKKLLDWFSDEWRVYSKKKLDMGKSCIRFKKPEDVPLDLIGELASKMTPQEWIAIYEKSKPK
jgi:hypothetical protein